MERRRDETATRLKLACRYLRFDICDSKQCIGTKTRSSLGLLPSFGHGTRRPTVRPRSDDDSAAAGVYHIAIARRHNVLLSAPAHIPLHELGPVEKTPTVGDKVYARLEQALMVGEFAPGQRLVTRTVAASMNVSPTPVREALNRLVSSHALRMDDNRVYCVNRISPTELDELYRIRFALEGLAASEAARRMDDVTLAKLHGIHAQMAQCIDRDDHKAALHFNRAFHFALYETPQMPMLNAKIRECWVVIGPYFNLLYPEQARQRVGVNNHQKILEAAAAKDPVGLRAALEADLQQSLARLHTVLGKDASTDDHPADPVENL
ncbi:GntR family transcriptional regulator [Burkholderia dolosa]|uniref:GntR family transcriptional regulator n=1 Tax=Burkholderia dolosa TaxID=152500 RepID=UPI001C97CC91|nr:GntR family transcriptional regulator [Burkholderia dolosa]MBY4830912.1 GntR family transcriptional regulator [Burkholderia dolosa]